jgi:hypothetical protein
MGGLRASCTATTTTFYLNGLPGWIVRATTLILPQSTSYTLTFYMARLKSTVCLPTNMYNMDEKGVMIGVTGRSKQVFSRRQWEEMEVRESLQDGSREWITVVAAVSAAGIGCLRQSFFLALPTHSNQPGWTTARQANTPFFSPQPRQVGATTTLD